MKDSEKFEGLRRRAVEENEARYGREIRRRFGDEAMDGANEKSRSLSEKQWADREALQQCVNDALRRALMTGDPGSPEAMELAQLHRKWLCSYWKPKRPIGRWPPCMCRTSGFSPIMKG